MKPLLQFWIDQYHVSRTLEGGSWLSGVLNRHVVGRLLNTFPRAATRMFAMSRGELARRLCVEKEGGSYRVLRAMYDFHDPHRHGDLLNRLLMQSPAAKAARNRRTIAQQMLGACLEAQPVDVPILVLAVGGGDGSLEAKVIARSARRDVYYCSVDKDRKAIEENRHVMEQYGLAGRGFVFTGDAAERTDLQAVLDAARQRFSQPFDGVSIAVCHGIAEYLDIGLRSNDALARLLGAMHACMRPEGTLMMSHTDHHDRVNFVERGLCWRMRLRSMQELADEIEKAGWQIVVCEHEPMQLITMSLAVKSDRRYLRVDSPSQAGHPLAKQRVQASGRAATVGR